MTLRRKSAVAPRRVVDTNEGIVGVALLHLSEQLFLPFVLVLLHDQECL
jgi:hypothetical protein